MNGAENVVIFDNLVAARGAIGSQNKVEVIKQESFVASNASGGLRTIKDDAEVGAIAKKTADGILKAFAKK